MSARPAVLAASPLDPNAAAASPEAAGIRAGSPEFRRACLALFLGGFSTFWLMWWVQPLLPVFSQEFGVSAAASSVLLSVATAGLAFALLPASALSDRYGRHRVMSIALPSAALLTIAMAVPHSFGTLVVMRTLLGIVLAGMPAVAMAYLGEEIEPASLGRAMGIYLSGNVLGGTGGRLATALLSDALGWRWAVVVLGAIGLAASIVFWRSLPASRRFVARPLPIDPVGAKALARRILALFRDGGLPWLFVVGFLLMGCFTSLYNYLTYRLAGAPFHLRPALVGAIFTIYLVGVVGTNWAGRLGDRIGRRNVLWGMMIAMLAGLLLTLSNSFTLMIAGVAVFTFCFFGAHAVASSWVGRRAEKGSKALASASYLCFYYLGTSVIGSLSGFAWTAGRWAGVVSGLAICLSLGVLIALRLRRLAPLPALLATTQPTNVSRPSFRRRTQR